MGKFYKPGKVVVVLNGRFAGHKGIIVKSNYESGKDRKYPHCLVVGLSKGPRKATKKNIAKWMDKIKKLEASKDSNERVNTLKSFGVFIKTYNMSHLLATRYTVKEDFGVTKTLERLDNLEKKVKEDKAAIDAKERTKDKENKEGTQKDLENLRNKFGNDLNDYKNEVKNAKAKIGTEMYKRFMQGFNKAKNDEDKENQNNAKFLFKKLNF